MTRYVALYCRLSPRPDGSYEGVDVQERAGRDYASTAWPGAPVRVFADAGISAANGDRRPEYEKLRQAVRSGEVEHLWCVEQSRLERREVEWFKLAAELTAAGIRDVHTGRDGVLRVEDEVSGIRAVLAAGEVRKLKARVADRLADNAAHGHAPGSKPFGYRHAVTGDGAKTYEVIPEQADAIRDAANMVLSGWSLANVAAELRKRGLSGAHGGTLTAGNVRNMLTLPTVAGHRVHAGRIVGPGNWPPILDEQTWQACRLKLSAPRRVTRSDGGTYDIGPAHTGNTTGRKYLLTGGLARCAVCTMPMVGSMKQLRGGRRAPYLLCHPVKGGKACTGILLDDTETHVLDVLWSELDRPEFLEAVAADDHAQRRDAIAAALNDQERQRDELAALWATPGELTTTEWQTARRALAENEQRLRQELAAVPPPW